MESIVNWPPNQIPWELQNMNERLSLADLTYICELKVNNDYPTDIDQRQIDNNIYAIDRLTALQKMQDFWEELFEIEKYEEPENKLRSKDTLKQLDLELAAYILDCVASNSRISFNLTSKSIETKQYNYYIIAIASTYIAYKFNHDDRAHMYKFNAKKLLQIFKKCCLANIDLFISEFDNPPNDTIKCSINIMVRCERFILETIGWKISNIMTPQKIISSLLYTNTVPISSEDVHYKPRDYINDSYGKRLIVSDLTYDFESISTKILNDVLFVNNDHHIKFGSFPPGIVAIS